MSPEQNTGDEVDARSDQFAFCVSLFEALTARRPFERPASHEISADAMALVPIHLRAALRRGLSIDPGERWRDMDALLAALVSRRRRSWAIFFGTVGLAGMMAVLSWWPRADQGPACPSAALRVEPLWGPERREALKIATLASDAPHASGTWVRIRDQLDAYFRQWAEIHDQACTPGDPLITVALRQERIACLDDGLAYVDQMLDLLEEVAEGVMEAALLELGRISEHRGDDHRALDRFGEVQDLWEGARGLEHPRLVRALMAIGRVNNRLGLSDEALYAYRRAHRITVSTWGPTHHYTVSSTLNVGEVYLSMGQAQPALEYFDNAIEQLRTLSDRESSLEGEALGCRSEALWELGHQGKMNEARGFAEIALEQVPASALAHRHLRLAIETWLEGESDSVRPDGTCN